MAFEIPQEFRSELEFVEPSDKRSDKEILESLTHHVPVTSEKNIWAFWHSGVREMPGWSQRNVVSWVRICGTDWTIRILDKVPESPNNVLRYIGSEMLPECFIENTMTGPFIGQHSSDFLRGPLLYTFGGVYMDVGCILLRHMDRIGWDELEDPASPYEIVAPAILSTMVANYFVASRKGSIFIKKWQVPYAHQAMVQALTVFLRHELFIHVWKGRENCKGVLNHPLLTFAKDLNKEEIYNENSGWDWKVPYETMLEYVGQIICWRRLCSLDKDEDGFNGYQYWKNHVLCLNAMDEACAADVVAGFRGERLYELLSLSLDTDPTSPEYQDAYRLVWRVLSSSAMQKVPRGTTLTTTPQLGEWWDKNPGKDCDPNTFAGLLRYGSLHFRQKRDSLSTMEASEPPFKLNKGVLEP